MCPWTERHTKPTSSGFTISRKYSHASAISRGFAAPAPRSFCRSMRRDLWAEDSELTGVARIAVQRWCPRWRTTSKPWVAGFWRDASSQVQRVPQEAAVRSSMNVLLPSLGARGRSSGGNSPSALGLVGRSSASYVVWNSKLTHPWHTRVRFLFQQSPLAASFLHLWPEWTVARTTTLRRSVKRFGRWTLMFRCSECKTWNSGLRRSEERR